MRAKRFTFVNLVALVGLLLPTAARAQVDSHQSSPVPRIVGEVLAGVAGEFLGGVIGWGIGSAFCDETARSGDFFGPCFMGGDEGAVGMVVGVIPGAALGTYVLGEATTGDGSYWAALAGSAVGTLGMVGLIAAEDGDDGGGLVVLALALPAIGATIGYELSQADVVDSPRVERLAGSDEVDSASLQVYPSAGVTPDGATFGLLGRF